MKKIEIPVIKKNNNETATIECDRINLSLKLTIENDISKQYSAYDLFVCFGLLRADNPEIKFLCKGSKLNVHPSRMSSQMSKGLAAYELTLGKPSDEDDTIRIFDYEDQDITNNIEDQIKFYKKWLESLSLQ
ncbi:hypothetical protein [Pseudomonas sp. Sample_22]|uniref:hypothetical protein n=1 Tax=Pseudomonas sp. Sample_22 TaxID=2448266 RepID=UPI001032E0CC|nr:hypothetical protein [Pseudomonas sp. Sample_22]